MDSHGVVINTPTQHVLTLKHCELIRTHMYACTHAHTRDLWLLIPLLAYTTGNKAVTESPTSHHVAVPLATMLQSH